MVNGAAPITTQFKTAIFPRMQQSQELVQLPLSINAQAVPFVFAAWVWRRGPRTRMCGVESADTRLLILRSWLERAVSQSRQRLEDVRRELWRRAVKERGQDSVRWVRSVLGRSLYAACFARVIGSLTFASFYREKE